MNRTKKTILTLFFAVIALSATALRAQDNDRIYIKVGATADITAVPLELYLNAPALDITALEAYIALPEGVAMQRGVLGGGCSQSHTLVEGATDSGRFVSIASSELSSIASLESPVCTWMCDFSALAEGDYAVVASGLFAVSVAGGAVECYTAADRNEGITIGNGTVTSIDEIAESKEPAEYKVYNLKGRLIPVPQKGAINIINGKKVRL